MAGRPPGRESARAPAPRVHPRAPRAPRGLKPAVRMPSASPEGSGRPKQEALRACGGTPHPDRGFYTRGGVQRELDCPASPRMTTCRSTEPPRVSDTPAFTRGASSPRPLGSSGSRPGQAGSRTGKVRSSLGKVSRTPGKVSSSYASVGACPPLSGRPFSLSWSRSRPSDELRACRMDFRKVSWEIAFVRRPCERSAGESRLSGGLAKGQLGDRACQAGLLKVSSRIERVGSGSAASGGKRAIDHGHGDYCLTLPAAGYKSVCL